MTTPKRAAIYARISDDRNDERAGVTRQLEDCRAMIDRNGWKNSGEYVDDSVSAYSGVKRPAYERLLADMERGLIDAVVCWHTDRLHRRVVELERYVDVADRNSVATVTVAGGDYDLASASGRAIARTLSVWAQHESEHRGERVRRASRQRALAGKPNGGRRPYGIAPGGTDLEPTEAATIRAAATAILTGQSLRSVVADLNKQGAQTVTGRPWTSTALRDILAAPRLAGKRTYRGEIVGATAHPPIITESEHLALVSLLRDPARLTRTGGSEPKWLGTHLYYCCCGSRNIKVGGKAGKRMAYRCHDYGDGNRHVTRDARMLDHYVESVIVERLALPDIAEALVPNESGIDVAAVENERRALNVRLDDVARAYADGAVTLAQLTTATRSITDRLDALDAVLAEAVERSPLVGLAGREDVAELWQHQPIGRKRLVLDTLLTVTLLPVKASRVFDPNGVRIEWR